MKVYTYDYDAAAVVETECEEFGHPHRDANGRQQYNNTHFRTAAEAHAKLLSELRAGMTLDVRELERRRAAARTIAAIEKRIVEQACRIERALSHLPAQEEK